MAKDVLDGDDDDDKDVGDESLGAEIGRLPKNSYE